MRNDHCALSTPFGTDFVLFVQAFKCASDTHLQNNVNWIDVIKSYFNDKTAAIVK